MTKEQVKVYVAILGGIQGTKARGTSYEQIGRFVERLCEEVISEYIEELKDRDNE